MASDKTTENKDLLEALQVKNSCIDENNTCRSTIAQFVAGWTACLSSMSLGVMVSFPTILIGELRKPNKDLFLNENDASWIGSLIFLLQPFCSVLGGLIQLYVGRKYGLILTFIPQLIGWLLVSWAKSILALHIAMILFGISVGSMETPTLAYLGEITQPRTRGKLTSSASILFSFGYLLAFLLGSIFNYRAVATICISLPVISIVSIYFIPDSPIWLLTRGRNADALKALCWLRGWVSPNRVQYEYENMCDYIETSNLSNSKPGHKQSIGSRLKNSMSNFMSPTIRKPFILISVCHFACHGCTLNGMRSYFIEVFETMRIPIKPPQLFTFVSCVLMICGGIICFLVIKCLGKRVTFLLSVMICSLNCISLSFYTFYQDQMKSEWIPTANILLIHLIMAIGAYPVPWMLTSEVFPLNVGPQSKFSYQFIWKYCTTRLERSTPVILRAVSTGLAAASAYIQGFVFSKTFYYLNNLIHLPGCFLLYGICGLIGIAYLYFELPETEGKTLAEIEEHFSVSNKKRRIDIM